MFEFYNQRGGNTLKKKMAFIDLSNFHNWPMGGMLEYELALLQNLVKVFDIDIWGVSVDGVQPKPVVINGKEYKVNTFANVKTKHKIIPNYWKGTFTFFKKKVMHNNYNYYYAHTGSCLVGIGLFEKNAKLIYHQHGLNYLKDHSLMQSIQRPFYNKAQEDANLVFVVSDLNSTKQYESVMKQKHRINAKYVSVKSPIKINCFNYKVIKARIEKNKNKNIKNFIYTGRLSKFKNAKLLIKVFNKYLKSVDNSATFTIVGSGEEEKTIKGLIDKFKLNKNVRLMGALPHDKIYNLLMSADAFLTASGGEGVSVSVAEAYAAGLPVVCFKVPGLESQVIDKITGKIAKDFTVDEFYDALRYVNEHHTELSKNCIKESKKYDSQLISQIIIKNILSL